MRWMLAWVIGLGAVSSIAAGELDSLRRIYGVSDLATITGNGGLTVGADRRGVIMVCRWPSPSHYDQLGYRASSEDMAGKEGAPLQGLVWGVEAKDGPVWLTDPRWTVRQEYLHRSTTIMTTTASLAGTDISIRQIVFAHPDYDLLVIRLEISGVDSPPHLWWSADFSPCTRLIPELPLGDWFFDNQNDFAAFALEGPGGVCHFRPRAPGSEDWRRARRLAEHGGTVGEWASFGDGAWIVCTSLNPIRSVSCVAGGTSSSAVGDTRSVIEVAPVPAQDGFAATIIVGFGENFAQASEFVRVAQGAGYEALFQQTTDYWGRRLTEVSFVRANDFDTILLTVRALLTLLTATDRHTGAMVRSPATQPPLARDWPRHGVWMTYALDLAGLHAAAEAHIRFYAGIVRREHRPGKPLGSVPAAVYTNGVEAAPHVILDVEAAGLLLWLIHEHGAFVDAEQRVRYFESLWDIVALTGDFVAGWSDERRGMPVPAFDPDAFHDFASRGLLNAAQLGVASAVAVAESLGKPVPALWARRQRELDVLVRGLALDDESAWGSTDAVPLAYGDVLGDNTIKRRLDEAVLARIDALPSLSGLDAARAFGEAALLARRDPALLQRLRGAALGVMERALTVPSTEGDSIPAFPDALSAAYCYIGAYWAWLGAR